MNIRSLLDINHESFIEAANQVSVIDFYYDSNST